MLYNVLASYLSCVTLNAFVSELRGTIVRLICVSEIHRSIVKLNCGLTGATLHACAGICRRTNWLNRACLQRSLSGLGARCTCVIMLGSKRLFRASPNKQVQGNMEA